MCVSFILLGSLYNVPYSPFFFPQVATLFQYVWLSLLSQDIVILFPITYFSLKVTSPTALLPVRAAGQDTFNFLPSCPSTPILLDSHSLGSCLSSSSSCDLIRMMQKAQQSPMALWVEKCYVFIVQSVGEKFSAGCAGVCCVSPVLRATS